MLLGRFSNCLVLGDGNFSFSASFAEFHAIGSGNGTRMVSTSFNSEDSVLSYNGAPDNLTNLRSRGVELYHCVDATQLCEHHVIRTRLFDLIVFNFPHTGGRRNKISENRTLLKNFLASAARQLQHDGHIVVLLCKGQGGTPADGAHRRVTGDSWQVVEMAAKSSLILRKVEDFIAADFVGYKRTGYRGRDQPFNTDHGLVHVFAKSEVPLRFGRLRRENCCPDSVGRAVALCEVLGDRLNFIPIAVPSNPLERVYKRAVCQLKAKGWQDFTEVRETATKECTLEGVKNPLCVFVPPCLAKTLCTCCHSERVQSVTLEEWTKERARACGESYRFGYALECSLENVKYGKNLLTHLLVLVAKSRNASCACEDLKDAAKTLVTSLLPCEHFLAWYDSGSTCAMQVGVDGVSHSIGHLFDNDIGHSGSVSCVLNLDKLACLTYGIGDCRQLWSRDPRFLQQFASGSVSFEPVSLYPENHEHHISFWLPDGMELDAGGGGVVWNDNDLLALVCAVGGDCVSTVKWISSYHDSNRCSQTYSITYQSVEQALSWEDSVKCQLRLREVLTDRLGLVMR